MYGPIVVLTTLVIVSGFSIFYLVRSRHLERMARIEHGLEQAKPEAFNKTTKSLGIFLISLGAALFCSYIFAKLFHLPDHILIPGSLLLFGGTALIIISNIDK